jgi:hypothetical protein
MTENEKQQEIDAEEIRRIERERTGARRPRC